MTASADPEALPTLGWREWVSLPGLEIERIKCKVDTGARTSSLHAYFVERFTEHGRDRVRFGIHPLQQDATVSQICVADVLDERMVSDSGGHRERRVVIETELTVLGQTYPAEFTLASRDTMRFRMLLGRTAIAGRFLVDSSRSYAGGRPKKKGRRKRKHA